MDRVRLSLEPLPAWLDAARLVGTSQFESTPLGGGRVRISLSLPASEAADVQARLRGLGLDGEQLVVAIEPPLGRALVRAARLRDARARRDITPGFSHKAARATGEGRYSLTPEPLALALGRMARGLRVLDACCGSGGNAIGFARAGCAVEAIELDRGRLDEARRNASLYGVAERIRFVQGDALSEVPRRGADVLFVDPPWGEHYDKRASALEDLPLLAALWAGDLSRFGEVWMKVPSSFRVGSISGASARAFFGVAEGDARRIKFVLLRAPGSASSAATGGAPSQAQRLPR